MTFSNNNKKISPKYKKKLFLKIDFFFLKKWKKEITKLKRKVWTNVYTIKMTFRRYILFLTFFDWILCSLYFSLFFVCLYGKDKYKSAQIYPFFIRKTLSHVWLQFFSLFFFKIQLSQKNTTFFLTIKFFFIIFTWNNTISMEFSFFRVKDGKPKKNKRGFNFSYFYYSTKRCFNNILLVLSTIK